MKDNSYANQCIRCTVENCRYHNDSRDYCSLDTVSIGTHESCPTDTQCVDCESFEAL